VAQRFSAVLLLAVLFLATPSTAASAQEARRDWKPADPAYAISLPRDHAAHPGTRIEWWYYTGSLESRDGRRFGYQLTFFRLGVDPRPENPSRWAVRDLYVAHFAISDVAGGRHVYADRLNRAGPGWAGATIDGYRVWNEDWEVRLDAAGSHRLRARDARIAIDLTLAPGKPPVLHGDGGYSRKGPTPGNASHYYSLTRMPTSGTLSLDGQRFDVTGDSWMDHEWGTSFLEPGQVGWDWFSLQLDDGSEVMLFQIRRTERTQQRDRDEFPESVERKLVPVPLSDPFASGTIVDREGNVRHLAAGDFTLRPGDAWTSPVSGARYPVTWSIAVPSAGLTAEVRAAFPAQELRTESSTAVTYWEGAIDVSGTTSGRAVRGRGYLEMTGYTGRPMSEVLR
jgi:predicted secreted hydrolase